jgi:uncharacterized protein
MRISAAQQALLSACVHEVLPDARVYLFGSRADDSRRGGDIDILVLGERALTLREKMKIKTALYCRLGDQKIDIVSFAKDSDAPFKSLALSDAIPL